MRCDEHKSLIQKNVYVHIINRDREHHSFTLHCVTYMFKYTFIFVEFVCFNITLTIYASIIFYSEYFLRNALFNPLCTQRNSTNTHFNFNCTRIFNICNCNSNICVIYYLTVFSTKLRFLHSLPICQTNSTRCWLIHCLSENSFSMIFFYCPHRH